jgi:ankyrin repeat protein
MNFFEYFIEKRRWKKILKGCDYQLAAKVLNRQFKGSVIRNELAALLENYMTKPCLETALDLIQYNTRFFILFRGCKPGGTFPRLSQYIHESTSFLRDAACEGHTETGEALIDGGADVSAKDDEGKTSLMWAAYKGHIETVEALIDGGADANAKDNEGRTALMGAADEGHTETVEALIDGGADVSAKDDNGRTALMWAANKGHIETVEALIDGGADINAKDNDGETALMHATDSGYTEVVELLIRSLMDFSPKYHDVAEKIVVLMTSLGAESISQRFLRAAELARTISPAIDSARREFLSICSGNSPRSPFGEALCFPSRFLGGSWKSQDVAESCSKNIQEVFDFGFLVHFAFTEFPTRTNFQTVDPEKFQNRWLPESLLAVMKMRDYSEKMVPQVPIEEFFSFWYEKKVESIVKSYWKIGFLKRSAVRSYFRATFFTGIQLAFEYDLATKAR